MGSVPKTAAQFNSELTGQTQEFPKVGPIVPRHKRHHDGPYFRGQRFYDKDFSSQSLVKADFTGATLHGCIFDNCDLSYAVFERADCTGSSFRQTRLYHTNFKDACLAKTVMDPRDLFGTTVTIHCDTVRSMKMSRLWVAGWLQLLMAADIPQEQKDQIRSLIEGLIGADRAAALVGIYGSRHL